MADDGEEREYTAQELEHLERLRTERRAELDKFGKREAETTKYTSSHKLKPAKQKTGKALETYLKDRAVRNENEFKKQGKKARGLTSGYKAKEDKKSFMVKTGVKGQHADREEEISKKDLAREYVFGKLYERLLAGRAPKIGLVARGSELQTKDKSKAALRPDKRQKTVAIRSQFIDRYNDLQSSPFAVDVFNQADNGFEKIVAACMLLGDYDYHYGNLGYVWEPKVVVLRKRGHGTSDDVISDDVISEEVISEEVISEEVIYERRIAKIDHGRSGELMCDSLADIVLGTQRVHKGEYTKQKRDLYSEVRVDPYQFKLALDQMLQVSADEIDKMILAAKADLVSVGLEVSELNDMEQKVKRQFVVMSELSEKLEMVARIRPIIKNWLFEPGLIDEKGNIAHPALFALERGKTMLVTPLDKPEGQKEIPAFKYVIKEGILFERPESFKSLLDSELTSEEVKKQLVLHAIENGIKIGGKDPLEYFKVKIEDLFQEQKIEYSSTGESLALSETEVNKRALTKFAVENAIQIQGKDPLEWLGEQEIDGVKIENPIKHIFYGQEQEAAKWGLLHLKRVDNKITPIVYAQRCGLKGGQDRILWAFSDDTEGAVRHAIKYGRKIEGKHPVFYALSHREAFGDRDHILAAFSNNKEAAVKWALENSEAIEGMDPILWADKKKMIPRGYNNFVEWAFDKCNLKEEGKVKCIKCAIKNNYTIEGYNPIIRADQKKIKLEDMAPMEWAFKENILIDGKDPMKFLDVDKVVELCKSYKIDLFDRIADKYSSEGFDPKYEAVYDAYLKKGGHDRVAHEGLDALLKKEPLEIAKMIERQKDSPNSPLKDLTDEALAASLGLKELCQLSEVGKLLEERKSRTKHVGQIIYTKLKAFRRSIQSKQPDQELSAAFEELATIQKTHQKSEVKHKAGREVQKITKFLTAIKPAEASKSDVKRRWGRRSGGYDVTRVQWSFKPFLLNSYQHFWRHIMLRLPCR